MKTLRFNNMALGAVLGLLTPALILVGINVYNFPELELGQFLRATWRLHTLGTWLLPSLLFNLPVFFLFINTNRLYAARGVILSTILYGLFIVFLFFLK